MGGPGVSRGKRAAVRLAYVLPRETLRMRTKKLEPHCAFERYSQRGPVALHGPQRARLVRKKLRRCGLRK
jgi:hypothetical protein